LPNDNDIKTACWRQVAGIMLMNSKPFATQYSWYSRRYSQSLVRSYEAGTLVLQFGFHLALIRQCGCRHRRRLSKTYVGGVRIFTFLSFPIPPSLLLFLSLLLSPSFFIPILPLRPSTGGTTVWWSTSSPSVSGWNLQPQNVWCIFGWQSTSEFWCVNTSIRIRISAQNLGVSMEKIAKDRFRIFDASPTWISPWVITPQSTHRVEVFFFYLWYSFQPIP